MRCGSGTAAAVAAVTAAYWTSMSSQSQAFGRFPRRGSSESTQAPTVALTFDDGPNEPFTGELAQILRERDVRATFFQVGQAIERSPDTSAALLASGHVLGNHSYSHQLHRCLTAGAIDDEIRRTQDVFGEHLGMQPRLYRPPWLARTPATFRLLRAHRLQAVSGTFCHPLEVAQVRAERLAVRTLDRVRPGSMMIFHDGYNGRGADRRETLDAVARVVDALGELGWAFATVDELLDVPAYS